MRKERRRFTAATVAFSAVLACAASWAIPAMAKTSPAPAGTSKPAAATAPAFPTFVHLPADQAAHPNTPIEWWYVVGHLNAHGHRFGYQVSILSIGAAPQALIAITDKTTGKYYTQSQHYSPDQTSFSNVALDVRTPSATLSGPMNAMRLHATMPTGEINLTLSAQGPTLYNNGTGLMPLLGGTSYYYSLPSLASQGTLTENNHTYPVTGESWLDRQWGNWDQSTLQKWTWMAVQLSNGDRVNLWDLLSQGSEFHYATVLRPDGTHEIVAVNPVADTTSGFWTSPTTGKRYGTRWTVNIPALDASLTVVAQPQGQEIQASGGVYEGASSVTGRYRGKPVTGRAYVEQYGNWR